MTGAGPARLELPLYTEAHGTEGSPLLLIHGLGANSYTWLHWIPGLARKHRVHLVELKGFGAAPKPRDGAYAPGDQAALIHRLIHRLELRELTLVGHSLGGGIALLTALKLLDEGEGRLARLVIVSGAALRQEIPRYIALGRIPLLGELLLRLVPPRPLARAALRMAVHDSGKVSREQVEAYAEPLTHPGARYALARTVRQLVPDDLDALVARYPEIDVPALLLWGERDRVTPPWVGERLRDALPRARLVVLPGCGHIPPEEYPRESLQVVESFLEEGKAGG